MSDNYQKVQNDLIMKNLREKIKVRLSKATSKATDTYLEVALRTVKTFGVAECDHGSVISALIIASAILNAKAFNDIVECEND